MKSIAWTIAGSDSRGISGIQADVQTFQSFGVHACTILSAVTIQGGSQHTTLHFLSIDEQLPVLSQIFPPRAIKIGMLGSEEGIQAVSQFLMAYHGHVVLDPVMLSSRGHPLYAYASPEDYAKHLTQLYPYVALLTPNWIEASYLLGQPIQTYADVEEAAKEFLMHGVRSVLIKGGHGVDSEFSQDYWTNGRDAYWLASPRRHHVQYGGTGCTLSSAITACLALAHPIMEAIVMAKTYLNQSMRLSILEEPV